MIPPKISLHLHVRKDGLLAVRSFRLALFKMLTQPTVAPEGRMCVCVCGDTSFALLTADHEHIFGPPK